MNILLDGYLDRNLGDDLMMCIASNALKGHKIYMENASMLPIAAREANGNHDVKLTVTGSGFLLYNYKTTLLRVKEMLRDSSRCKRAVISCNISDFPNGLAERVIKKQLSRFDFITVRDKYSYDYIRSELPGLSCEYYPDIVFSLPKETIADKQNEGALGISAYGLADKSANERLAAIADEWAEKTGNRVLLFALDIGNENDVAAAEMIKGMMKRGDAAQILKHDALLANIRRCSRFIGIRFHAVVIALLAGVPVIPIVYSNKTSRMLDDLGFNGDVFELNAIDGLYDAVASDLKPFELSEKTVEEAYGHMRALLWRLPAWDKRRKDEGR